MEAIDRQGIGIVGNDKTLKKYKGVEGLGGQLFWIRGMVLTGDGPSVET